MDPALVSAYVLKAVLVAHLQSTLLTKQLNGNDVQHLDGTLPNVPNVNATVIANVRLRFRVYATSRVTTLPKVSIVTDVLNVIMVIQSMVAPVRHVRAMVIVIFVIVKRENVVAPLKV